MTAFAHTHGVTPVFMPTSDSFYFYSISVFITKIFLIITMKKLMSHRDCCGGGICSHLPKLPVSKVCLGGKKYSCKADNESYTSCPDLHINWPMAGQPANSMCGAIIMNHNGMGTTRCIHVCKGPQNFNVSANVPSMSGCGSAPITLPADVHCGGGAKPAD